MNSEPSCTPSCTPDPSPVAQDPAAQDPAASRAQGGEGGRLAGQGRGEEALTGSRILEQRGPIGYPLEERAVRSALGLSKNEARALRHRLLAESDFAIHKKRLYLTQGAFEKMRAAVEQYPVGSSPGSIVSEGTTVKAPPEPVTLLVVNPSLKNPHLILACMPGDSVEQPKNPLRVRVRSQEHFVTGMEIPAILVAGYSDLYDLGRPCPRKRGKW